jgi:hypothetical protein
VSGLPARFAGELQWRAKGRITAAVGCSTDGLQPSSEFLVLHFVICVLIIIIISNDYFCFPIDDVYNSGVKFCAVLN